MLFWSSSPYTKYIWSLLRKKSKTFKKLSGFTKWLIWPHPSTSGHEIYNFCRSFFGHHYYTLVWCIPGILFVLFVWGFTSHSRIFHSYGDFTITDEGLQILAYAWPLSSEGSLESHTNCKHPFIMGHLQGPVTLTHAFCRALSSGAVTTCFCDLGLCGWDLNTQPSAWEAKALTDCATAEVIPGGRQEDF